MKQVVQNYQSGSIDLVDVPAPLCSADEVVVRNVASLISVGTERYMVGMGKKTLLGKAIARPDLVKQVIRKVQTDGPLEAYRQAKGRLDSPVSLGYSAAGVVVGVGNGVAGFAEGDRVACAGSGVACHAEVLRVPRTLAVKVPDSVNLEAASFVALGGIAMHGIRMAKLTFGERVVVLGLGLLGQLAIQIARSAGCRICGLDVSPPKVRMAMGYGAHAGAVIGQDDVVNAVRTFTNGHGADAVLILASTESNEPIELAAEIARERGRIVVPGLVGLNIPRKSFYEKELEFVVSRAWGPGMYDPEYESGRTDYPLAFVRWTAQRNMAHFMELLADGRVAVDHLITHRYPIDRAVEAYEMIIEGGEQPIGVILEYPAGETDLRRTIEFRTDQRSEARDQKSVDSMMKAERRGHIRVGLIGAGLFAKGTLLPALTGIEDAKLHAVATATGLSGEHLGRKYKMAYCTTDTDALLADENIDLVMVLTRHGSHADLVCRALVAEKHVFVEKPLALNEEQLQRIIHTYSAIRNPQSAIRNLVVGFNRRFAPTTQFAIERLSKVPKPFVVNIRVNVGHIPREVWVHHAEEGGGNLIGEACHFVDLIQALTGSFPVEVYARAVRPESEAVIAEDNFSITISLADGSTGNILYTALGDKSYQRERVEIFGGGAVCTIDNFKTAAWSQGGRKKRFGHLLSGVDRGHRAEMQVLISALRNGQCFPVPFESYVATTRTTFAAMESLRTGKPVCV